MVRAVQFPIERRPLSCPPQSILANQPAVLARKGPGSIPLEESIRGAVSAILGVD